MATWLQSPEGAKKHHQPSGAAVTCNGVQRWHLGHRRACDTVTARRSHVARQRRVTCWGRGDQTRHSCPVALSGPVLQASPKYSSLVTCSKDGRQCGWVRHQPSRACSSGAEVGAHPGTTSPGGRTHRTPVLLTRRPQKSHSTGAQKLPAGEHPSCSLAGGYVTSVPDCHRVASSLCLCGLPCCLAQS